MKKGALVSFVALFVALVVAVAGFSTAWFGDTKVSKSTIEITADESSAYFDITSSSVLTSGLDYNVLKSNLNITHRLVPAELNRFALVNDGGVNANDVEVLTQNSFINSMATLAALRIEVSYFGSATEETGKPLKLTLKNVRLGTTSYIDYVGMTSGEYILKDDVKAGLTYSDFTPTSSVTNNEMLGISLVPGDVYYIYVLIYFKHVDELTPIELIDAGLTFSFEFATAG